MSETVLITGASAGIGVELARLFAAEKCNLILVARSGDKMKALAGELQKQHGIAAHVFPCDLSVAGAARQLFDQVSQAGLIVDVLVNNAGFGSVGRFARMTPENQEQMIELNVTALTMLTRYFLDGMLERKRGRILNVASVAAFQPGPVMAVYYATKAYVLSFSEALAEELKGTGISVSILCPGPTVTEFQIRAGIDGPLFKGPMVLPAKSVAQAGHRALRRGKVIEVPGLVNKFLAQGYRFFPRFLVRKISMQFMKNAGRDI